MSASSVSRIAVERVDMPGRWFVISHEHVAYAFLGRAVSQGVVQAPLSRGLTAGTVYLRTIKGGLYRTGFGTLAAVRQKLGGDRFIAIHRLAFVNVGRLVQLDLVGAVSLVGVAIGNEVEFLRVGRRHVRRLREAIGLPKRMSRQR